MNMDSSRAAVTIKRIVTMLILGITLVFMWRLLIVAIRLRLEYWDGYDYLNNALLLAGNNVGVSYNIVRPPLVSLLNAFPLMFYTPGGAAGTLVPHLIAFVLSCLAALAMFRLLRLSFSPLLALGGMTLLVVNPLFVHYSVFTLTDIPSMLFLTVGFYYYGKTNDRATGVGFFIAILSRYTNIAVIASLVLYEILSGQWRTALTRSRVKILALWAGCFYVLHLIIFLLTTEPKWKAPFYILTVMKSQFLASRQAGFVDPIFEFPSELLTAFSLPILIFAVAGLIKVLRRKTKQDLLMLCWFLGMFGMLMFARHKEARYLFCVFPPVIYLTVAGFESFLLILRSRRLDALAIICGLALMIIPVWRGVDQLKRFEDATYRGLFLSRVTSVVTSNLSPDDKVYWSGIGLYNIYPERRNLFPFDEFIYFHHFNADALAFTIGKPVTRVADDSAPQLGMLVSTKNRMYANMPGFEPPEPPESFMIRIYRPDKPAVEHRITFR